MIKVKKKELFYINGWEEGRSYFQSIGRFTESEYERMREGETISRGDNEFRIETEEVWYEA